MKTIIIRDDDVHAFTPLETLKKVYNTRFFDAGFKLSLSVIPNMDTSVQIKGTNNPFVRRGYIHEPFIPKDRVNTGFHSFGKNAAVAKWLSSTKSVETCLHGYSHSLSDFASADKARIRSLLHEGRKTVESAIGKRINTFVPPHERLSKAGWQVVNDNGMQLFRNIIRPLKDIVYTVPVSQYGLRHARKEFFYGYNGLVKYRSAKELGCMEPYLFSPFWDLEESFRYACEKFDKSSLFIMTNHHWEFDINPKMLTWWRKFVRYMSEHEFVSMTATEAMKKLRPVNW
ncbi:MAG: DUF2334 domain-containing protein [Candidatus Aenigmarchaeota archaeon]|nr:DUF2334 domain-containing protein [Candidatus Aenigmarchaeota archaeon]